MRVREREVNCWQLSKTLYNVHGFLSVNTPSVEKADETLLSGCPSSNPQPPVLHGLLPSEQVDGYTLRTHKSSIELVHIIEEYHAVIRRMSRYL